MRSRVATVLTAAAALLVMAASDAPGTDSQEPAGDPRPAAPPFTIAVLPDTQYEVSRARSPERNVFSAQTAWLATQRARLDLRLVVHEGDVVDDRCSARQWQVASAAMARLDGQVPWTVLAGNHDLVDYQHRCAGRTSRFAAVFSPERLERAASTTWGGARRSAGAVDSWHRIRWGGNGPVGADIIVVSLRYGPDAAAVAWARDVIQSHPDATVILVTHDYLDADGRLRGAAPHRQLQLPRRPAQVDGVGLWRQLVAPNPNVRLVLSGHVVQCAGEPPGVEHPGAGCRRTGVAARRTTRRADGSTVTQLLANYQVRMDGGGGFLRLLQLDPAARTVGVTTWSPTRRAPLTDPGNRFVLRDIDLGA
ncbi:MAG: hypothetical protein JWM86_1886 [Thermoleophilia bacterium]|nr:hypothetical protein [Thermoleophilia bacterium]